MSKVRIRTDFVPQIIFISVLSIYHYQGYQFFPIPPPPRLFSPPLLLYLFLYDLFFTSILLFLPNILLIPTLVFIFPIVSEVPEGWVPIAFPSSFFSKSNFPLRNSQIPFPLLIFNIFSHSQ